jgi:hypothetical protein
MRQLTIGFAATLSVMTVMLGRQPGQIVAQAGTPVATAECRTAPRSLAAMQALFTPATPGDAGGTAVPSAAAATVGASSGVPADAETVAAVTATAQEVIACSNAGLVFSAIALYSDNYLRARMVSPSWFTQDVYDSRATPHPVPTAAQVMLVELREIQLLTDGRVSVVTVTIDPTSDRPQPDRVTVIYIKATDRWQIDEIIDPTDLGSTPVPAGTPGT